MPLITTNENQTLAISSIRLALQKEYGCFVNEDEQQKLSTEGSRIAPY
jgi:hypothetical protein